MLVSGSLLVLAGGAFAVPFFWEKASHNPVSMLFFFVFFWFQAVAFKNASKRWFGMRTEFKATQKLIRWIPKDWQVKQGVFIGAGDLDIMVTSPEGRVFAIEVKSQKAVGIRGWFTKKLIRTGGDPFPRDPLKQAYDNAQRVRGEPILWFPLALEEKLSELDGVKVVLGQKDLILRALGLRKTLIDRLALYLTSNKD